MLTGNAKNVRGELLKPCSMNPRTGFFRDGCCKTGEVDFFSNHHFEGTSGNLLPFSASLLAYAFGPAEMPYNNAGELASEVAQVSAAHSPRSARHRV